MSSYIKTERSWFLILLGACFAVPSLLMMAMNVIPRFYAASQKYFAWKAIQSELLGDTGMSLVFVFIFGIVGFGIMYWGWSGKKVNTAPETLTKPWLSKPEWMHNRITSGSKSILYITAVFAVVWNLMTWPIAFFKLNEVYQDEGVWLAALIALFPVIGLFVIFQFFKRLKEWRRFGITTLVLNPFPGAIGGQVGGTIETASTLEHRDTYKVTLSCIKNYYRKSGSESRLTESLVWHKQSYAKLLSRGEGSALAFKFDVPEDLPVSDLEQHEVWHVWRISVESSKSGFDRDFEIPVFDTGELSTVKATIPQWQEENEDNKLIGTYLPLVSRTNPTQQELFSQQGLYNTHINHDTIHYPMFHRPSNKLFFVAFGLALLVVGILMWDDAPIFMSAIFSIMGGTSLLFSVYLLLNSFTVVMDRQSIITTSCFLGVKLAQKETTVKNIKAISSKEVMRSESAGKHTVYYKVMASLYNGEDMLLAKQIEGERAVNLVIDHFHERLGMNHKNNKPKEKKATKGAVVAELA